MRFYDSASATIREFEPVVPGEARIYYCGATVQGEPHLGHIRSALVFDQLSRWMRYRGLKVTTVRNVTDIDDKILAKSADSMEPGFEGEFPNEQWWALAYRFEKVFDPPTYEPRATGHIPEMFALIERLIDRGHAYPALDDSGYVYFDVRSWDKYGALTNQSVEDMQDSADADPRGKRDPRDFALWKGYKEGEPLTASWESPWGRGRPGWHLECSAMATYYLGAEFDVHCGGLDLQFPHHENEIAQSHAAGDGFARYWMHNHWVTMAGEKMSKSLGNVLDIDALLEKVRPVELRYYLGSAHYRSVLEYSEAAVHEAAAGFRRIEDFVNRASKLAGAPVDKLAVEQGMLADAGVAGGAGLADVNVQDSIAQEVSEHWQKFAAALDDDFAVPRALAVIHTTVKAGNNALAGKGTGKDAAKAKAVALASLVRAMTAILGIDPLDTQWAGGTQQSADGGVQQALASLVEHELELRAAARREKDFATADGVRDRLAAAGIEVIDTPGGAEWKLR